MRSYIIVGCDLSDDSMVLKCAWNDEPPHRRGFNNDPEGRDRMVRHLRALAKKAGGARIVFAYEAGPHGFGLWDDLTDRGIECHALAPTRLPKTPKSRKDKNDDKDALRVFEALRGHLLAGNHLPSVWVPDVQTRDDRELVRARLDAVDKRRRIRSQIRMFLKRHELRRPKSTGKNWTIAHLLWLTELTGDGSPLMSGARSALAALLRQMAAMEEEVKTLEEAVMRLSREERYRAMAPAVDAEVGVGLMTAMIFLTEMGDPDRFRNRRQVAAYFGLVPSSNETGKRDDRKGHITRQGSRRIRWALCQAEWAAIRSNPQEKARHERVARRNPKRRKVATVAGMRRMGIRLWHRARRAKAAMTATAPPLPSPRGGEAPACAAGAALETTAASPAGWGGTPPRRIATRVAGRLPGEGNDNRP